MLDLQVLELLQKIELFKAKLIGFRELFDTADDFRDGYFEVVSGRPAGEVYHRAVYVSFTKEMAEDCESHILDEYEEWELENWLWGPHIYPRQGNPAHTKVWDGFSEVPAPMWHPTGKRLLAHNFPPPLITEG